MTATARNAAAGRRRQSINTRAEHKGRVERVPYELCVLVALRDAVRRREIWVVGANRWRNPEDDLPADFEDNRDVHYAALGQPQDAGEFIGALQGKLRTSLDRFEQALAEGTTGGVAIVKRHGKPWIRVSPRAKQEEPESLVAVKGEIERRCPSGRRCPARALRRGRQQASQRDAPGLAGAVPKTTLPGTLKSPGQRRERRQGCGGTDQETGVAVRRAQPGSVTSPVS
ncbi:hypothetical protein ACFRFL_41540 [Streptomyces sp. NPDC056708]|uniref:hypothetical protein n=1 Tax=unclassified Streptomyces TaxID=2593676 RepID=UPI0036C465B0